MRKARDLEKKRSWRIPIYYTNFSKKCTFLGCGKAGFLTDFQLPEASTIGTNLWVSVQEDEVRKLVLQLPTLQHAK
jgi:hypothetical protein